MQTTIFRTLLALFFLAALPSLHAWAQTEQTGAIRGIVKEQSGGVIPNAQVTLKNDSLNYQRTTTTNKDGAFIVMGLPPGNTYQLIIQADHFQPVKRALQVISSGDSVTQDFTLEVASLTETVSIVADTPAIVSNAPEVSQVVDARRVTELPSAKRSVNGFALLDPHVRNTAGQGSDGSGATRLAINANSFRHTNYQLDGASRRRVSFAAHAARARRTGGGHRSH